MTSLRAQGHLIGLIICRLIQREAFPPFQESPREVEAECLGLAHGLLRSPPPLVTPLDSSWELKDTLQGTDSFVD